MQLPLSPLESAVLQQLLHGDVGRPSAEEVQVVSRQATPCGRFVQLRGPSLRSGGSVHVEMEGIPNGLTVDLRVDDPGSGILEIVVNGGDSWNGYEHRFRVL